ncbi:MAG TPA: hypothetical protein VFY71_17675 [Planctomycetota bacterium]|nr:hypothetical protein [Planctomycetota bacterium]
MISSRLLFLLSLCPAAAAATDLNLSAQSGGQNKVVVTPGSPVSYAVVGELSNGASLGLAMVSFDLSFSGGSLTQADTPASQPMANFAAPLGLNNPAGYGGTVVAGNLVQVGGAQNTILNVFAPLPMGSVVTGVAQPGSPQVIATGTLTAPTQVGTYTLTIDNVMGNVIRSGETGVPFWAVDPAGVGSKTSLTIEVAALFVDKDTLTVSALGSQHFSLDAGVGNAGRQYLLMGTFTGTVPGITLAGGTHLPLNPSVYLNFTGRNPNTPLLSNSGGNLDASGHATASFNLPHVPASAAGLVLDHAYILMKPIDFASNAVEVTLVP